MYRYSMLSQRYNNLFTVTLTHYFPFCITSPPLTVNHSQCRGFWCDCLFLSLKKMFGPFRRQALNVKPLRRSDERLCVSVGRHASKPVSRCPESTGPKDKPARHIKPGALIIQRRDSCRRQINVFYNSSLAFHCDLSRRDGEKKRSEVVLYHRLYLLKWTNWMAAYAERGALKAALSCMCEHYTVKRKPWNSCLFALKLKELQGNLSWTELRL